jgi:tetratricopeptide (TPR) repeat protein
MTIEEYNNRINSIKELFATEGEDEGHQAIIKLVADLTKEKEYQKIVQMFQSDLAEYQKYLWIFEVAYAFYEKNQINKSEQIYEYVLSHDPNNWSVLNNLYLIKKSKGLFDNALKLIQKAHKINPDDTIISKNYRDFVLVMEERAKKR